MRQKILKQVGVLLTVSILLTFLVVSLTMYSKFNGYMHESVREEAEYIKVAIEETDGAYLNEKIPVKYGWYGVIRFSGRCLHDGKSQRSPGGTGGRKRRLR